jgi:hypothetical protein
MPIRPELRHFYRGPGYRQTRARIVKRAHNRCEQCGKPNRRRVWVCGTGGGQYWTLVKGALVQRWHYCFAGCAGKDSACGNFRLDAKGWKQARRIRVVCTMAHLNHTPGDDRDENLKFLCQWCHLNYDRLHHKETRTQRKDAARPLLKEALEWGREFEALGRSE